MGKLRRVIIVHGWNDSPQNAWIEWLGTELARRGFEVVTPELPNPKLPNLEKWIQTLQASVGELNEGTTIVTYSLGTPTTLRLLSDYVPEIRIAGLVTVAGFGDGIAERPGVLFDPPIDFDRIRRRVRRRVAIYSDNDIVVRPARSQNLAQQLRAKEVVVMGAGHFLGKKPFPSYIERLDPALEAVLSCYPRTLRERLWQLGRSLQRGN